MSFKYVFVVGILTTLLLFSEFVNSHPMCPNGDSNCKPITDPTNPWMEACKEYSKSNHAHPRQYRHISNGTEARPNEFPFIALIGRKDERSEAIHWLCGGTLITPSWVLAPSYCILQDETLIVRLGEHDYSTADNNTQDFEIVNTIFQKGIKNNINGIALIKLNRNATLNSNVLPACLPVTNTTEHNSYQAASWELNLKSTKLIKQKVFPSPLRSEDFEEDVNKYMCAAPDKDSAGTCLMSGPLFVPHPSVYGMYQVVGISLHDYGQCGKDPESGNVPPTIYERLSSLMSWINLQTNNKF